MKKTEFLLKVRENNIILLSIGLVLVLAGTLSALVLNNTAWWNYLLIGFGLVILGLFLFSNLTEIKEVGKKRTTITRANLTLVAVAMLGIVIALNYIVSRHPLRIDLTSNKFYTLSDQTLDTLNHLQQDVNVSLFTSPSHAAQMQAQIQRAQQLLEEYGKKSTKFHFKTVNVDNDPAEARRYGIHEYNTIVFESGDNRKDVLQRDYITYSMMGRQPMPKFQGEAAFTSALITMSDTTHLVFYFTEGHGEKPLVNPQPDGYTTFKDMLEKENYTDKTLNLLQDNKIPDDAAGIVILGPVKAFQPSEEALLETYLKNGGKIMVCLDLMDPVSRKVIVNTGLSTLFKDFGVKVDNDLAIDETSYMPPNPSAILPQYGNHDVVQKLSDNHVPCLMVFNRGIEKIDPLLKGATSTVLLQTTDKGWGVNNVKALKGTVSYHPGIDVKGPIPIAVASEFDLTDGSNKKARLVVYGNSLFFSNQFASTLGNADLALNTFGWMAEQENKISIHPKEEDERILNISNVSNMLIIVVAIILIPLAALIAGFVVWFRRRSI
jgi:ABC-2 type transport system permease protein